MKKKPKDVLIMCQYFTPENISSATLPYDTAIYLSKKGLSVDVITGKSKIYNNEKKIRNKETIDGVNIKRVRYFWTKSKSKLLRIISFITFTLAIYLRMFSFKNYKAIMVYSNPPILPKVALLTKRLFGNKVVFVSYDVYPEIAIESGSMKDNSFIVKSMRRNNKKLFPKLDKVVALSNEMKMFMELNRNIKKESIVVIPNWHKDLYDENLNSQRDDKFRISYFGNMGTMQDINTILKTVLTLSYNNDIEFYFAGHGVKYDLVDSFVKDNNLSNIILNKYLKGKEFEDAVNNSDMFIVSLEKGISKLAYPSKMSNYLMGGKPIISVMDIDSDISTDVRNYKLGISVKNGDYKTLSKEILSLYKNKSVLKEMSVNSRQLYLNNYTPEISLEKYYKLINEMLED